MVWNVDVDFDGVALDDSVGEGLVYIAEFGVNEEEYLINGEFGVAYFNRGKPILAMKRPLNTEILLPPLLLSPQPHLLLLHIRLITRYNLPQFTNGTILTLTLLINNPLIQRLEHFQFVEDEIGRFKSLSIT